MKNAYGLKEGDVLADKYVIVSFLGAGWEGEVFKIKEIGTEIERAAKIFHPKRNPRDRTVRKYANRLHKLRNCQSLIQYHTVERSVLNEQEVSVLISEYVEGELLSAYLRSFRGGVLPLFQALHLLYALADGIEDIHHMNEYHGDIHSDNIIVQRFGLFPEIKFLDLYYHGRPDRKNMQHDIISIIKVFHEALGGQKTYRKQPPIVHEICCGLKHGLILKRFPDASELKWFLESEVSL